MNAKDTEEMAADIETERIGPKPMMNDGLPFSVKFSALRLNEI